MPDPKYAWDAAKARYRYVSSGRLVPATSLRGAVDTALTKQGRRARGYLMEVRDGTSTPAEFEQRMRQLVKDTHLYGAAAGAGGWDQMDAALFGKVGGHVGREYGYLRGFREELESVPASQISGGDLSRAELYAESARRTYYEADRAVKADAGFDMVRNILHPADHCDECQELTDAGLMPVDDMPMPGDRECMGRCRCSLSYEAATDAEEVAVEEG